MNQAQLERECRVYTLYLTRQSADAYIIGKYVECHATGRVADPRDSMDRALVDLSARTPFWARLADTYASRFHKHSTLRKKVVLTLALLECSPATFEYLDGVDAGGTAGTFARLAWSAVAYAGALVLAALVFLPVRVWTAFR